MIIIGVRPCRQHQVAVLTDDGREIMLDTRTWEESPYGVDSSLSEEELVQLCAKSDGDRARDKAVFLLSRRDYSRKELAQKLCRERGRYCAERQESAEQAAAYMEELGYVNDEAYAARLARHYQLEKLYPRRRAVEKLCEKGIPRGVAQQAVEDVNAEDAQLALEFLRKKRYTIPQSAEETDKQAAAMARYGFSYDDIRRAFAARKEEVDYGD